MVGLGMKKYICSKLTEDYDAQGPFSSMSTYVRRFIPSDISYHVLLGLFFVEASVLVWGETMAASVSASMFGSIP